jgi:hypothetical protein
LQIKFHAGLSPQLDIVGVAADADHAHVGQVGELAQRLSEVIAVDAANSQVNDYDLGDPRTGEGHGGRPIEGVLAVAVVLSQKSARAVRDILVCIDDKDSHEKP